MRDENAAAPDAELVALAEELRQAVGSFVRKVRAATDTPHDARLDTLDDLDRHGPMTVAALARLRQVRHQSMRMVVAQLETKALLGRAPDAQDARGQIVAITEAGRTALMASRSARARWIASGLQAHTTLQERQAVATAVDVLRRLTARPD